MLKIRLKRIGKKKVAKYKLVVMNAENRRDGKAIDYIGFFDPHNDIIEINKEKFAKWLNNGAQPTDRVKNLVNLLIKNL